MIAAPPARYNRIVTRLTGPSLVFAVAAFVLVLGGCSKQQNTANDPSGLKPGAARKSAPAFSLKDANGATVTLADFKGQVVLINFWATWCGPCKVEIPWFVEFQQKYKDRDFAVLGVSMDEDGWKAVKPYLADHKINYRVVIGDEKLTDLYGGIDSLPTSFIIDRNGRLAATHIGLVDKSDYQNEILKLLEDPKPAAGIQPGADVLATLLGPNQRP